jgi:DNA replication and repair protein RecF
LVDFRSYERFEMDAGSDLTVIVGSNAAGKTNIVESLQLLTAADSFRKPPWRELVRWGTSKASLKMTASGDGRVLQTTMDVSETGRRVYTVNGKVRPRVADVAGILPCVVFTPDDLRMVKDSAGRRREAVDSVGDQLSPAYRSARVEYERILRHRNQVLRADEKDTEMLELWTSRLIESGQAFSGHRSRLFSRLAEKMSEVYRILSGGETLLSTYQRSWERDGMEVEGTGAEQMENAIHLRLKEEAARRTSLIGPHRDEVTFQINSRDARSYASQGQQRTIALAWKLAEVKVIAEIGGNAPILLLDDVMSELDEMRRHALARFVGEAAQTFITTTNLGYFEAALVERALVVKLS